MFKREFIRDILAKSRELEGLTIRVCGWVYRIRDLGGVRFIILRDRTGVIQSVFKRGDTPDHILKIAEDTREEGILCVDGILRRAPTREGYEILALDAKILSNPIEPLPLETHDSLKASLPTRLKYRWLDARNPKVSKIFQLKSWVARKFREYYSSQGFIEIFTPKIVASGTESGADVFSVLYFDRIAYLAQSPQFYKQFAVIAGFEKVYEVGPVFRAEPHHTTRHLNEYHSLDIEIGFIESFHDVMDYVEGFFRKLAEDSRREEEIKGMLEEFEVEPIEIPETGIPRIPIRRVYEILASEYGKKIPYGEDLDPEGEKLIGNYVKEKYKSDLVFIIEYPWKIRPFYTMRKEDEPSWTYSFDLLLRGLEVVTGGQREHRYEKLKQNLKDKGLAEQDFQYYLDFFKYGVPPHGGAGMGLERITMQILRLQNIREARLLPRDTERITP
ncbi:MAG: aspartate--tRNA(Asn) ligase [Acidilobaceae archaeon]